MSDRTTAHLSPGTVLRDPVTGREFEVVSSEGAHERVTRTAMARLNDNSVKGFSSGAMETSALYGGGRLRQ